MICYHDLASLDGAASKRPRVATVGYFDGLHIGHQSLLSHLRQWADELDADAAVVTFSPHPASVLHGTSPLPVLSLPHRLVLFARYGATVALALPFTREVSEWSAEEFIERVLVRGLRARHVLMGFDSAWGRGRHGTFAYLSARAAGLGVELRQAEPLVSDGERISSTLVRDALQSGDLERLKSLLGRRFSLLGKVVTGEGRGKGLGFATANLDVAAETPLPPGVYFALATVWEMDLMSAPFIPPDRHDGERIPALVNIGRRPTFRDAQGGITVEAHLLDFEGDLYDRHVELHFLKHHRPERKFDSVGALAAQIRADETAFRELLSEYSE